MADKNKRNQLIALGALLFIAALVWYFGFSGSSASRTGLAAANYQPINAQDFGVVFGPLQRTQGTEYKTSGRNIFSMTAVPVEPQPGTTAAAVVKVRPRTCCTGPTPPPPPPPATLPMKFFGYGSLPSNGPRRAFLQDGDDVRIVEEGETLLNHIRITHIGNERIEFVDTNTGLHGSNPLDVAPAPAA